MEDMEDRLELLKMERDYNNKLDVYNMYINQGKEPPRELIGSLDSLGRSIQSMKNLIRTMESIDYNSDQEKRTK